MRMYSASGRSRWPIVIGAAVVVVAVGGGIVYATNRGNNQPTATITTSAPAPAVTSIPTGGTSGSGDNENDEAPTGCLGGQDRDAPMVLAAQKAAKHSTYGAVEVATSFYRWLWQYPTPNASDADTVSKSIMAITSPVAYRDLAGAYQRAGDKLAAGEVPPGTSFHVSTTNGIWRVTEHSTSNQVYVTFAVGYVIDGALSPTKTTVSGFVMDWENGAWRIEKSIVPDQTVLANGGTRYTGGC
ncbi:hypothetical protein [Frondihabitans peucedani]|uniref:Mce-associated membrane protein n=1 Tax=Frondihabitans peucedani TaxID=598626 RepID=A0ABP8E321_9MICO